MSEKKKSSGCASGSCGCSSSSKSETKAAPVASDSKAAKPSKTETSSAVKKSNTIQNGKGSAPRNMGPTFKKNFTKIKWGEGKTERQEGRREVKVYG